MLIGGLANCIGIFYSTYTAQNSKPTTVALLRYIGVVYAFLVDLVIFKEHFNLLQVLGIGIILTTNIAAIFLKTKQTARPGNEIEVTQKMITK